MNGAMAGWHLITSSVVWDSIPGPVLSNVFITDLNTRVEHTIGRFADDTGGAVDRCLGEGSG